MPHFPGPRGTPGNVTTSVSETQAADADLTARAGRGEAGGPGPSSQGGDAIHRERLEGRRAGSRPLPAAARPAAAPQSQVSRSRRRRRQSEARVASPPRWLRAGEVEAQGQPAPGIAAAPPASSSERKPAGGRECGRGRRLGHRSSGPAQGARAVRCPDTELRRHRHRRPAEVLSCFPVDKCVCFRDGAAPAQLIMIRLN